MTRRRIMEYVQALRKRYFRAAKEEKGKMLDEFTQVTGLHRKAAIRLLNRPDAPRGNKRHGRPAKMGNSHTEIFQPYSILLIISTAATSPEADACTSPRLTPAPSPTANMLWISVSMQELSCGRKE